MDMFNSSTKKLFFNDFVPVYQACRLIDKKVCLDKQPNSKVATSTFYRNRRSLQSLQPIRRKPQGLLQHYGKTIDRLSTRWKELSNERGL